MYFGGKPLRLGTQTNVVTDRLGSVRREAKDFFPYGQERTVTAGETEKYATYMHDGRTDLAYADQRYYATEAGRFMTADPAGSGLNWYAYTGGDPVNNADPSGLGTIELIGSASLLALPDGGFLNVGGSGAWGGGSIHWAEAEAAHQGRVDSAFAVNALNSGVSPTSWALGQAAPNADWGSIALSVPIVQSSITYADGTTEAGDWRVTSSSLSNAPFVLFVNSRPANIPGGALLSAIGFDHQWISTSSGITVGMGTQQGVPQSNLPGVGTFVVDHSGQVPLIGA